MRNNIFVYSKSLQHRQENGTSVYGFFRVWISVMLLFSVLECILQLVSAVAQGWTSSKFSPLCLAHISHDGVTA